MPFEEASRITCQHEAGSVIRMRILFHRGPFFRRLRQTIAPTSMVNKPEQHKPILSKLPIPANHNLRSPMSGDDVDVDGT